MRRFFLLRLSFRVNDKKLEAIVEHASGRRVIYVSTSDPVVRQYLHSSRDSCAAVNLGRVVADRCLKFGIDQVKYLKDLSAIDSIKVTPKNLLVWEFYNGEIFYCCLLFKGAVFP